MMLDCDQEILDEEFFEVIEKKRCCVVYGTRVLLFPIGTWEALHKQGGYNVE